MTKGTEWGYRISAGGTRSRGSYDFGTFNTKVKTDAKPIPNKGSHQALATCMRVRVSVFRFQGK